MFSLMALHTRSMYVPSINVSTSDGCVVNKTSGILQTIYLVGHYVVQLPSRLKFTIVVILLEIILCLVNNYTLSTCLPFSLFFLFYSHDQVSGPPGC